MPDLPQTVKDPLEDAEFCYAITLSKEAQQKVRGRECALLAGLSVSNYLSFFHSEILKRASPIDQSNNLCSYVSCVGSLKTCAPDSGDLVAII